MRPRLTAVFSLHWGFSDSGFAAKGWRAEFNCRPWDSEFAWPYYPAVRISSD